ncbi:MAG: SDR family oxidoreductase [Candidatus Limnocylindrales bacterium]
MRVAVTGANGRLGRALVAALADAPFTGLAGPLAWGRPDFDLDEPRSAATLIARDRPEVIVHAAAWTDVDGCAREPATALRRNGTATGVLAIACAEAGVDLIAISTNEVFDGRRLDGRGYLPTDPPAPINPYGASKLAGEEAARSAFAGASSQLAIVRTAWLFGPGEPDFPTKILRAADRAVERGERLRVVGDEYGTPTYAADVAEAVVELLGAGAFAGTHHVVDGLFASRADWARNVVGRAGLEVEVEDVPATTWDRASDPPRWGVLEQTPLPSGEPLRPWPDAMADYAPILLRAVSSAGGLAR